MEVKNQNYQKQNRLTLSRYQIQQFLKTKFSAKRPNVSTLLLLIGITFSPINSAVAGDGFNIDEAKWDAEKSRLKVKGTGKNRLTVTLSNANSPDVLGTKRIRDGKWRFTFWNPESVPCRVKAEQSDGKVAEKNVEDAPANCDGGIVEPPPPPPPTGNNGAIRIIAANDLGMHCADKDYQIFSILPPLLRRSCSGHIKRNRCLLTPDINESGCRC